MSTVETAEETSSAEIEEIEERELVPSPHPRTSQSDVDGPAKRRRFSRFVAAVIALAVLIVAGAATGGWYLHQASESAKVTDASSAATDAAKRILPQLLSYDHRTFATSVQAAKGMTTGPFSDEFGTLMAQVVQPMAAQQEVVTQATVPAISVVHADRSDVVLLAFIDQSTTAKDRPGPSVSLSGVRVTLHDAGGQWLVSALQPV